MRTDTQKAKILKHLKSGKPITPIEALRDYGIFRLSGRIFDIKDEIKIEKRMVKLGTKYFAEYRRAK